MSNLRFGIDLQVQVDEFKKEWQKRESELQSIIDKSKFKIKVEGAESLKELENQLKRIQNLQKTAGSKPLTAYRAAQVAAQKEVAMAKQQETAAQRVAIANNQVERSEAQKAAAVDRAAIAHQRLIDTYKRAAASSDNLTGAYKRQSAVLLQLKSYASMYFSVMGAFRLVENIKEITSDFELQRVSLKALTQDAEFAADIFDKIKTTSVKSPFSTKQLITYTKQLAAYRVENENLYETMNMLADVSAGLGVSMDRLILAYGQVKAASVLRGTELRQFTEAGIPLVDLLAKKFSDLRGEVVQTSEVFDLISKRQVPFEYIKEIFEDMTSAGGQFYKMQEKQAESLYGVYENLKDNLQIAMDEIGRSNRWALMGFGELLTFLAKHLNIVTTGIGAAAVYMMTYKVATMAAGTATGLYQTRAQLAAAATAALGTSQKTLYRTTIEAKIALSQAIATGNKYAIFTAKAALANNALSRTFYRLAAAIAANPLTFWISAATTAASIISSWAIKTAKANKEQREHNAQLSRSIAAIGGYAGALNRLKTQEDELREQEAKAEGIKNEDDRWEEKARITAKLSNVEEERKKVIQELIAFDEVYAQKIQGITDDTEKLLQVTEDYVKQLKLKKLFESGIAETNLSAAGAKYNERMQDEADALDRIMRKDAAATIEALGNALERMGDKASDTYKELSRLYAKLSDTKDGDTFINVLREIEAAMPHEAFSSFEGLGQIFTKYDKAQFKSANSLNKLNEELQKLANNVWNAPDIQAMFDKITNVETSDAEVENIKNNIREAVTKAFDDAGLVGFAKDRAAQFFEEISGFSLAVTPPKIDLSEWRQDIGKGILGKTDAEAEALKFADAIGEVQKEYKQYAETVKSFKGTRGITDPGTTKELTDAKNGMKEIEAAAKKYGFALEKTTKGRTRQFDALKEEYELVQKIYKRYNDLLKITSKVDASAKVSDIYGNLTKIDFLDPAKYKARLQELRTKAEKKGDKDLAIQIGLAIQDIDFNNIKEDLKQKLSKLSKDIERTKTAVDFYEQFLGLSGDARIASRLTIDLTGVDINTRDMRSMLAEQLAETITSGSIEADIMAKLNVVPDISTKDLQQKIESGEVSIAEIQDLIDSISDDKDVKAKLQAALKPFIDYNKGLIDNMYQTLKDYDDVTQKQLNIDQEAANKKKKIWDGVKAAQKGGSMTEEDLAALRARAQQAADAIDAGAKLDKTKLTDDYLDFFTGIASMSVQRATDIRNEIRKVLYDAFAAGAIDSRELMKQLRDLDTQYNKLIDTKTLFESYMDGGVNGLINKYRELGNAIGEIGAKMSTIDNWDAISDDSRSNIDRILKLLQPKTENGTVIDSFNKLVEEFGYDYEKAGKFLLSISGKTADDMQNAEKKMRKANEYVKNITSALDGMNAIVDQLNENRSEDNKIRTPLLDYFTNFTKYAGDAFNKLISGDLIGAVASGIQSVISIFNTAQANKVAKLTDKIKEQERALKNLEVAYEALKEAEDALVGSDWVRNQLAQIEILKKELVDFSTQLELERKKGKSADASAIEDYESKIRDAEKTLRETRKGISTEMAGTDAASAAKEFASEWLNAYLSVQDGGEVLKGKFQDMLKSMVSNSLLAKVVEKRMKGVFDAIDAAYEDADLSSTELTAIKALMDTATAKLPAELQAILEQYDWIRDLRGGGETTNIAKDAASLSEQTGLAIAGAANSMLYYQVWIKDDLEAIRMFLEGRSAVDTEQTGGFNVGQLMGIQNEALEELRAINLNTASSAGSLSRIEDKLDSVIGPVGAVVRKVVNVRI